jgi:hypothetical protein
MRKTFEREGVTYVAFPEYGCFFGVTQYRGRTVLVGVTMLENDEPENGAFDVCNTDGDPTFVAAMNDYFGTAFTEASFPGR